MKTQIFGKRLHRLEKPITQIKLLLVLILIAGLAGVAYAEETPKAEIKKVVRKEVIGQLISRTPIKNPKSIGIACKNSNRDAYFIVDEVSKVVNKKSLDEIRLGDTIAVTYDEVTEVTEEGREQARRTAKVIRFVGPATMKIRREPGEIAGSEELSILDLLRSMEDER